MTVAQLEPRMRLGKTIYGTHGEVLLTRGSELGPVYIAALRERGFHAVYVQDGIADDVEPIGIISERLRVANVRNVQTIYELMAEATQGVRDQVAKEGAHVLPEVPLDIGEAIERQLLQLDRDAEDLLGEALETKTLAGIASLKSHDNYTFEHSVDVAFYGVVLGRRMALDRSYLKDLAVGCLLHDIGKMYVDDRILTKPGKLTAKEFQQIQQHTVLGFQMLRQMPFESPRPPHVALQHHEHQDGSGYPSKLFGTNQIYRTQPERFSPRRITLLAELGAVADAGGGQGHEQDTAQTRVEALAGVSLAAHRLRRMRVRAAWRVDRLSAQLGHPWHTARAGPRGSPPGPRTLGQRRS